MSWLQCLYVLQHAMVPIFYIELEKKAHHAWPVTPVPCALQMWPNIWPCMVTPGVAVAGWLVLVLVLVLVLGAEFPGFMEE